MSRSTTRYEIVLESNRIRKDWDAILKEFPEKMHDCIEFLKNNSEDRNKAVGSLKKLKGNFQKKRLMQYDISKDDARVIYRVDRKNKLVVIKYAGHHPSW